MKVDRCAECLCCVHQKLLMPAAIKYMQQKRGQPGRGGPRVPPLKGQRRHPPPAISKQRLAATPARVTLLLTRQDEVVLNAIAHSLLEEPHVLAHGIGSALEPLLVGRGLRGSEHLDKAPAATGLEAAHSRVLREQAIAMERSASCIFAGTGRNPQAAADGD